eukprot:TRINITY_DN80743_c0_g1_i1.p1 TRINITY_DN80743_c0_g1~~TRINITY_DN80743_c0_g1_i1.p1  ORF type:complete len:1493 (+),score=237.08 TRINITY_DN80743_c0_g1_i1:117-4595(+)
MESSPSSASPSMLGSPAPSDSSDNQDLALWDLVRLQGRAVSAPPQARRPRAGAQRQAAPPAYMAPAAAPAPAGAAIAASPLRPAPFPEPAAERIGELPASGRDSVGSPIIEADGLPRVTDFLPPPPAFGDTDHIAHAPALIGPGVGRGDQSFLDSSMQDSAPGTPPPQYNPNSPSAIRWRAQQGVMGVVPRLQLHGMQPEDGEPAEFSHLDSQMDVSQMTSPRMDLPDGHHSFQYPLAFPAQPPLFEPERRGGHRRQLLEAADQQYVSPPGRPRQPHSTHAADSLASAHAQPGRFRPPGMQDAGALAFAAESASFNDAIARARASEEAAAQRSARGASCPAPSRGGVRWQPHEDPAAIMRRAAQEAVAHDGGLQTSGAAPFGATTAGRPGAGPLPPRRAGGESTAGPMDAAAQPDELAAGRPARMRSSSPQPQAAAPSAATAGAAPGRDAAAPAAPAQGLPVLSAGVIPPVPLHVGGAPAAAAPAAAQQPGFQPLPGMEVPPPPATQAAGEASAGVVPHAAAPPAAAVPLGAQPAAGPQAGILPAGMNQAAAAAAAPVGAAVPAGDDRAQAAAAGPLLSQGRMPPLQAAPLAEAPSSQGAASSMGVPVSQQSAAGEPAAGQMPPYVSGGRLPPPAVPPTANPQGIMRPPLYDNYRAHWDVFGRNNAAGLPPAAPGPVPFPYDRAPNQGVGWPNHGLGGGLGQGGAPVMTTGQLPPRQQGFQNPAMPPAGFAAHLPQQQQAPAQFMPPGGLAGMPLHAGYPPFGRQSQGRMPPPSYIAPPPPPLGQAGLHAGLPPPLQVQAGILPPQPQAQAGILPPPQHQVQAGIPPPPRQPQMQAGIPPPPVQAGPLPPRQLPQQPQQPAPHQGNAPPVQPLQFQPAPDGQQAGQNFGQPPPPQLPQQGPAPDGQQQAQRPPVQGGRARDPQQQQQHPPPQQQPQQPQQQPLQVVPQPQVPGVVPAPLAPEPRPRVQAHRDAQGQAVADGAQDLAANADAPLAAGSASDRSQQRQPHANAPARHPNDQDRTPRRRAPAVDAGVGPDTPPGSAVIAPLEGAGDLDADGLGFSDTDLHLPSPVQYQETPGRLGEAVPNGGDDATPARVDDEQGHGRDAGPPGSPERPPSTAMVDQGQQTTPPKEPVPRRRWNAGAIPLPKKEGELDLYLRQVDTYESAHRRGRPRRHLIPPLAHWNNETVVYERRPGSRMPEVRGVLLAKEKQPDDEEQEEEGQEAPAEEQPEEHAEEQHEHAPESPPIVDGLPTTPPSKKRRAEAKAEALRGQRASRPSGQGVQRRLSGRSRRDLTKQFVLEVPAVAKPKPGGRKDSGGSSQRGPHRSRSPRRQALVGRPRRRAEPGPVDDDASVVPVPISAALAAFDGGGAVRLAGSPMPEGFAEVPLAEESEECCQIRVGLDYGNWLCCSIHIPPRSHNSPETLVGGKMLLVSIDSMEEGNFFMDLDGEAHRLGVGDHAMIRPGSTYQLRNASDEQFACLKMVVMHGTPA